MDSIRLSSNYELRFDGELLDAWFKGDRRVYRCDPRMVTYRFSRARVFGGEYLELQGQAEGDEWMTRVNAEYVDGAKALIERAFHGGTPAIEQVKATIEQAVAGTFGSVMGSSTGGVEPSDPVERLVKLADLHERGALTDAEFATEKAKILKDS